MDHYISKSIVSQILTNQALIMRALTECLMGQGISSRGLHPPLTENIKFTEAMVKRLGPDR